MRISLTTVYVTDQDKALRFYTEALGFVKKADFSKGSFRWLTVSGPDGGAQLQLAADDNPAAKAFQQALLGQGLPAAMFETDDVDADCQRITAAGGELVMPPTDVTGSRIAKVADGCGNLVQITQLKGW
ncbi:MAG: VOC family protein [Myxococcales bacterium]|nr:VOC family protein [Myxococcales bacterium]